MYLLIHAEIYPWFPIVTDFIAGHLRSQYLMELTMHVDGIFPVNMPHYHDDVIKWKHFPRYWPFVRGIHWLPVNSPHKGQWRGDLMLSFICAWINNREAGDLGRHRAHNDVIVMILHCYVYCYYGYYYGYEKGNLPATYKSTGFRSFFLDYRVSLMAVYPGRMLHVHVA